MNWDINGSVVQPIFVLSSKSLPAQIFTRGLFCFVNMVYNIGHEWGDFKVPMIFTSNKVTMKIIGESPHELPQNRYSR